jgi:hypothetical protein
MRFLLVVCEQMGARAAFEVVGSGVFVFRHDRPFFELMDVRL